MVRKGKKKKPRETAPPDPLDATAQNNELPQVQDQVGEAEGKTTARTESELQSALAEMDFD